MSGHRNSDTSSRSLAVQDAEVQNGFRGRSPSVASNPRATSIARLASPVPSVGPQAGSQVNQPQDSSAAQTGQNPPFAGVEGSGSLPGPGQSALAAAFQGSIGMSPPRHGTPPVRLPSPKPTNPPPFYGTPQSTYGSFDSRTSGLGQRRDSNMRGEDPKIVKRHLVQPSQDSLDAPESDSGATRSNGRDVATGSSGPDTEEFSSLKLQGGDVHREVYRWTHNADSPTQGGHGKRSRSFHLQRPEPESETENYQSIRVPGGFRRDHLRRRGPSPVAANNYDSIDSVVAPNGRQNFLSSNFLEFLTVYGHFAGEELEDDQDDDYFTVAPSLPTHREDADSDGDEEAGETRALITPRKPRQRRKTREQGTPGTNTRTGAALLLLKSFVGTGVLFLPRAYFNGGMLFSNLVLLGVAMLSYYCFILLVNVRLKITGSFGDMGGILYGKWLRFLILSSVALSQIGFVSAYIVFTSENLQAFIVAVSKCKTWIDIKFMVLMQLVIFLPLSLIRDISKLGKTALVADAFIVLGLIYLYYFDISVLVANNGVSDIAWFNPDSWTLFIGTAIFTFEGVGLIIPIQESMRNPTEFPPVLAGVMVIITVIFVSMGALSYAAFGSRTKTVVLLNLPQDDKFVNGVQLLYSLAILLSTPLQLFPAIRIMEGGLFSRSGKFSKGTKWKKNIFRFCIVIFCALLAWLGAGDLDKFVSIVGSFACVPLIYVYPAMLHYRAVASSRAQKAGDAILCAFGLLAMVYTTTQTLKGWATSPTTIESPGYCNT